MSGWYFGRTGKSLMVLALLICASMASFPGMAAIVYVDNSLGVNGSGTSPADACNNIQDALTWSSNGDVLWIATGIYNEGVISVTKELTFAGGFEHGFASRNLDTTPTTITGNSVSRDSALVRVPGTANVKFDGLQIIDANNGALSGGEYHLGGAMYLNGVDTVITSCSFLNNALVGDPASYNGNSFEGGGAISIRGGSPHIENCLFDGNSATGYFMTSGAIYLEGASTPMIVGCQFFRNTSSGTNSFAGGLGSLTDNNVFHLVNCVVAEHTGQAAIELRYGANVIAENCTFYNNDAHISIIQTSSASVTNCIFDEGGTAFQTRSWSGHTPGNYYLSNNLVSRSVNTITNTFEYIVTVTPNLSSEIRLGVSPSVRIDPMLTDPANGDFTPLPWSPAIDAALSTDSLPTYDADYTARLDGNAFNAGAQADIGAYEGAASANDWDPNLIHVKIAATGTGFGTDWANAATMGILAAGADDAAQDAVVWMAEGTYDMSGTDLLPEIGQTWIGGFPNTGDPGMAERDPILYPTILDGGDSNADVLYIRDVSDVTVDGLTLTNASARALYAYNAWNCVGRNLIIRDNRTNGSGAGAQMYGTTSFTLASSYVMNNYGAGTAGYGAGMQILNGPDENNPCRVNVVDTKFINNVAEATYDGRAAAAIQINNHSAHVSVDRCVFAGNKAVQKGTGGGSGAAINCRYGGRSGDNVKVWVTNSIFAGNAADNRGGAIYYYEEPEFYIVNCTFVDNVSTAYGGGAYLSDAGNSTCINNIFLNNDDGSGRGLFYSSDPSTQDFSNNLYYQNTANYYGTDDQTDTTPAFLTGLSGSWTAAPVFSTDGSSWTLLTDASASWTPGALTGMLINPDADQTMHTMIVSNTATQMVVIGGAFGATSGDTYSIPNFTPGRGSGATDAAISVSPSPADFSIPTVDINGAPRDYDQPNVGGAAVGGAYDIGAIESQTTYATPIVTYVNDDATAGGDGSIGSPYQTIAAAVASIPPYGIAWGTQVYVATGTYPETVDVGASPAFRGGWADDFSSRDVATNPTTIDGQKIVRTRAMVAFSGNAQFDGFTVTNGHNSTNEGGAMRVINCTPTISSCTLFNNYCQTSNYMRGGGGVYFAGGSVNGAVLAGCTVTSNTSYNTNPSGSGTAGAGVSVYGSAEVLIDGCFISANRSIGHNSAYSNEIMLYSSSVATVRNTVFKPTANFAAYVRGGSSLSLYNCTIAGFGYGGIGWRDTGMTLNVFNTIFDNCDYAFRSIGGAAAVSIGNNLFNDLSTDIILPTANDTLFDFGGHVTKFAAYGGSAAVETYPAFVDADNNDYRIDRGSPATDVGLTSSPIPAYDAAMNPRGHDVPLVGLVNGVDIGAYELQVTSNDAQFYVNDNAAAGGNGTLAAPLTSIQNAVNRMGTGPGWATGIYVAGGDYYEQVSPRGGMEIRGGYSEDFTARDVASYPSVIDGQNTPRPSALLDLLAECDGTRVDGFTITRSWSTSGNGGGVRMMAECVVSTCTIVDNLTTGTGSVGNGGAGVMISGSGCSPATLLANCVIENNVLAAWNSMGSGIAVNDYATPTIMDCVVTNNTRQANQWYGSCIGVVSHGNPTAINCVFADSIDRLLYVRGGSAGTFINCTILGHESSASYGLGIRDGGNQVAMINCIFDGLNAAMYGSVQDATRTGNEIYVAGNLFNDCGGFMPGAFYLGTATTLFDGGSNVSEYTAIGGTAGTDTDPLFMPIGGQTWSFITGPGSAAIDAGISSDTVPATDILDLARDGSPDIGAYEYQVAGLAPMIIAQPQNVVVDPGDAASLVVAVVGSPMLNYQWEFNDGSGWVNIGTNGAVLDIDAVAESDEGSYRVTITNDAGSVVSSVVTITVNDPPAITVEPTDVHVALGSPASFSVTVTGSTPLTFQWQKDGAVVSGDTTHVITSTDTGSTLNITSVVPTDVGVYRVQVSNSAGMARSVYVALTIDGPVQILRQPTTQTTAFGSAVDFTVFVSGTQPIAYAWNRNGSPLSNGGNISGATSRVLTLDPVGWTDSMGAQYHVHITNALTPAGVDSVIVGIRLLPTGVSPWWEMMK